MTSLLTGTSDPLRLVSSLVRAELSRLRRDKPPLVETWTADTTLAQPGLEATPMEQRCLARALTRLCHLPPDRCHALLREGTLGTWAHMVTRAGASGQLGQLTFRTSGSTSTPKACVHAASHLWQEATVLADLFPGTRRVVALVPCHHIYGFLFTVLLPQVLGSPVVEARSWPPSRLARELAAGDLLVSHPRHWRLLQEGVPHWPAGIRGVTSTAPCPPELIRLLRAQGLERMTEVYGSSETAGVGARHDPADAYTLFLYWRRAGRNTLIRRAPDGAWQPPTLLMDDIEWLDERHFLVGGRHDGAVQVAGMNVHPGRVAALLRQHPQVADCAVRLMRPNEGERLKAFLVLRPGAVWDEVERREFERWCQRRLASTEMPRALTVGAALPRTGIGKAADWCAGERR